MPEGHTLFALARDLHEAFAGTTPEVTSPQGKFAEGAAVLSGHELLRATSRGKHLFVEFADDRWLHVHLGLIGSFTVDSHEWTAEVPAVGQVRLRLRTDQHVADLRGPTLCEVATPEQVDTVLDRLGPDPLRPDSDPDAAWARISRSSRTIGELLMDQAVLAGVGNVYRSEVLFRHRLSPFTEGRMLRRASWHSMFETVHRPGPKVRAWLWCSAQEEARMLNHNYIGTEHILLGLIHEGEGVASQGPGEPRHLARRPCASRCRRSSARASRRPPGTSRSPRAPRRCSS
jgi:endonuclease-8